MPRCNLKLFYPTKTSWLSRLARCWKTAMSDAGQVPACVALTLQREGRQQLLQKGLWCKHCQQVPPRQTAGKGQNVIRPAAWHWIDLYEHLVVRKSRCPQLWRESSAGVAKSRSIPWTGMSLACLRHWCRLAWRTHSISTSNRLQTSY